MIAPAHSAGVPCANRRRILLGAVATSALLARPARAQEPHPDAALLLHRAVVLAAIAAAAPIKAEMDRLVAAAEAEVGPPPATYGEARCAWDERRHEAETRNGADDAWDRWVAALEPCDPVRDALLDLPARTIEGVCFKAVVAMREGCLDDSLVEGIIADLLAIDTARVSA